jgi:hypothetical protein
LKEGERSLTMYGSSLLPRNPRRRTRPDRVRPRFVRPSLEELESRTVLDASTGVFTTGTFAPAVDSSFSFVQFGPFATATGTSPFNVNSTTVFQGTSSPATSLQTVGGLPTTALFPGTNTATGGIFGGAVSAQQIQIAANDQAGVPGTSAPNPLFPLNPLQIEQATSAPATPQVAIQAWSPILSRLNPVETQMAASVFPIADFVGNSAPLPLLTSLARANSGAGNGGVAVPASGLAGGSGPALPVRPAAGDTGGVEDELLDVLRGLSRLDDLSNFDRPVADGQQADQGDPQTQAVVSQNTLFADGDWIVHRPDDRIPAEVLAAAVA